MKKILIIGCKEIFLKLDLPLTEAIYAPDLEMAMEYFQKNDWGLVIIDEALSASNNHKFLHILRKARPIPILVLSSQANEQYVPDRQSVFKAGAHAYLTRPYTFDECIAQIQSLIQLHEELLYHHSASSRLFFDGGLIIDSQQRSVQLNGQILEFTKKEFDILLCLATHPQQVFSREQLYCYVWDTDISFNIDEVVKTHIKKIRKKLSVSQIEYIENVWGIGYRFITKKDDKP